jgi:hypothetical protein
MLKLEESNLMSHSSRKATKDFYHHFVPSDSTLAQTSTANMSTVSAGNHHNFFSKSILTNSANNHNNNNNNNNGNASTRVTMNHFLNKPKKSRSFNYKTAFTDLKLNESHSVKHQHPNTGFYLIETVCQVDLE